MASQTDARGSRIQAWLSARSPWQRRGLLLLAGALATLAHAPFQLTLLYGAALPVLVWMLDIAAARDANLGSRMWSAFSAGWWFAIGHFVTGVYWVMFAFNVDSDAWGPIWGIPATLFLAVLLAAFWGAGCALMMPFWTRDWRRLPVFAACLFIGEWLRGNAVFNGFPWLLGGYVWTPGEPVSQLASLVGIYGLTLITLLLAAAPATLADGESSAGRRFAPLIAAGLAIGLAWGWGAQRIAHAPVDPPGALPVVRVADSGLSQGEKWRYRPDQEYRVLQRYLDASGPPDDSHASVLIWPEGAVPTLNFFQLDNAQYLEALGRGLGDRALIVGLTRCAPKPECDAFMEGRGGIDRLRLYNSAAVIDGVSGAPRLSQTYDKHTLVPGGEYIPLWSLVSRLNIAPLQRIGAGFTAGEMPTRLIVPEAPPAAVLICYEAIFPGMVPGGDERPGWIVAISNDAWFGSGTGPAQHWAMARYRAIEEGLPLARAASGGVSGIVDAFGRVVRSTSRRGGYAEAQLPPALPETSLRRWGKFLLPILLVIIAGLRFLPTKSSAGGSKS
ncbi:apolipoprotein N-acyltransferase [Terricaulis sp.]|uniref:apolipoprotein N-acyltransferase n=1 Tax=Terricaulis sp. TaxID=2768686 RepID=UPI00378506CE